MTDSPNLALLIETLIADAIFLRGEGMNKIAADCDEAVTLLRAQPSGDWVKDAARWNFYASSPQTALMLGSDHDPNDSNFPWREECDRLADEIISAAKERG